MKSLSLHLNNQILTKSYIIESENSKGLFGSICGMFAGIFGSVSYSSEAQKARKEVLDNKKKTLAEMQKKLKEAKDKKNAASIKARGGAELQQWKLRQQALIDRIKAEELEIKQLGDKLSKTTERYSGDEIKQFVAKIDKLEKGLGEQERTSIDKIKDKMLTYMVDNNGKLLDDKEIAKNLEDSVKDEEFRKHFEKTLESAGIPKESDGTYKIDDKLAKQLIQLQADNGIGETEEQLNDKLELANKELTEFEAREKAYNEAKTKNESAKTKIKEIEDKEKSLSDKLGSKTGIFSKKIDLSKINPDNLPDNVKEKIAGKLKKVESISSSDIKFTQPADADDIGKYKKDAIIEYLKSKEVSDPDKLYNKLKEDSDFKTKLEEIGGNPDDIDINDNDVNKKLAELLNTDKVKSEINKNLEESHQQKIEDFKKSLTEYQESHSQLEDLKKEQKETEEIINTHKEEFDKPKTYIDKRRKELQSNVSKLEDNIQTVKNAGSLVEAQAKEAINRIKNDNEQEALNKIIPGVKDKIKNNYLDLNAGERYNPDNGEIGIYDKDGEFIKRPDMSDENSSEVKAYKQKRNEAIVGGYGPKNTVNFDVQFKDGKPQVFMDGELQDTSNKDDMDVFRDYYISQEANTAKSEDVDRERKTLIENSKKRLTELTNKDSEKLSKTEKEELENLKELVNHIPDDKKEDFKDFIGDVEKTKKPSGGSGEDDEDDAQDDDERIDNDDDLEDDEEDENGNSKKDPRKIWKQRTYKRGDKKFKTKSYYNKKGNSISKDEFKERLANFERSQNESLVNSLKNYIIENKSNSNYRNLSNYIKSIL